MTLDVVEKSPVRGMCFAHRGRRIVSVSRPTICSHFLREALPFCRSCVGFPCWRRAASCARVHRLGRRRVVLYVCAIWHCRKRKWNGRILFLFRPRARRSALGRALRLLFVRAVLPWRPLHHGRPPLRSYSLYLQRMRVLAKIWAVDLEGLGVGAVAIVAVDIVRGSETKDPRPSAASPCHATTDSNWLR